MHADENLARRTRKILKTSKTGLGKQFVVISVETGRMGLRCD